MAGAVSVLSVREPGVVSAMDPLDAPGAAPSAWAYTLDHSLSLAAADPSASLGSLDLAAPLSKRSSRTPNRLQKRSTASASPAQLPSFERSKRNGPSSTVSSPGLPARDHPASPPSATSHKSPSFPVQALTRDPSRKKNFRWLAKDPATDPDQIDLSRTVAENEERSGLGISMTSPTSIDSSHVAANTTDTEDLYRTSVGSRAHSRTFSHNSAASNISGGSFKPTVPFVHPYRHSPGLPPSANQSQGNSQTTPIDENCDSYFPGEGTAGPSTIDGENTYTPRVSSSSIRPALHVNTSTASNGRFRSVSHTAAGSTASLRRPRRATDNSVDSGTPPSRTSLDRAFSFFRGSEHEPLDPIARAATIQAARQAFDERQEAKNRKYEKQERKAAEKADRQAEKAEDRQRRKSEIAEKKRASNSLGSTNEVCSPNLDSSRLTNRQRQRRASAPAQARDVDFGHERKSRDRSSVSKRTAKTTNAQFWLWLKTRVVHRFRETGSTR